MLQYRHGRSQTQTEAQPARRLGTTCVDHERTWHDFLCPPIQAPELGRRRPKPTKINHPNRTVSSAQRFFRRSAPEKFFRANHPDAKLTRPPDDRSPNPKRSRTRSNTTERPNARSSALSGTSVARRRESLPSRTPDREPHWTPGLPFAGPGTPSNRIEQDRTPPNARTHDLQRSAVLPPKDARHSLRPERSELEEATYSEWSS